MNASTLLYSRRPGALEPVRPEVQGTLPLFGLLRGCEPRACLLCRPDAPDQLLLRVVGAPPVLGHLRGRVVRRVGEHDGETPVLVGRLACDQAASDGLGEQRVPKSCVVIGGRDQPLLVEHVQCRRE